MKICFVALCLGLLVPEARAAVVFYEELPYFGAADSPFYAGIQAGTIYLEDFEDHELNTPYITSWDSPRVVGIVNGLEIWSQQLGRSHRLLGNVITTWSVDADDGLNGDFSGLLGDTWTTLDQATGQIYGRMEFRFSPDSWDAIPLTLASSSLRRWTHSVKWSMACPLLPSGKHGGGYDPLTWEPSITFPGDTRQHRFFGTHASAGIWRLNIDNVRQIDHLQYGYAIPEPATVALGLSAVLVSGFTETEKMSVRFSQFVVTLLVYALTLVGVAPANACDRRSTYYIDHWHSAYGQNNWFSDPDGDGVVNYVEFGFGTNPLSAAPGQGMEQVQPKVRLNANGQMELIILQPNLPCDSGGYGRYWFWISVLESPDLQSWNEIAIKYGGGTGFRPREGYSVTATQLPAGNWEVVITEQQPAAGRKWFRLSFYIVS